MERALSQDEIDNLFRGMRPGGDRDSRKAEPYDFRRPDRIAKEQLRAVHLLHENFSRNLASSLSPYLRAYVVVNLISVEQLSFAEFSQCLPSPACLVSLAMKPYEGNAVLEINHSLVFPILEMLLGGSGRSSGTIRRGITDIEQVVLDGVYRIILNDLSQAWHGVTRIGFTIENRETEPQLLQIMAPNEAVVAITLEVRIGDASGLLNIGMPSILIKKLRQTLDQQWSTRRGESSETEQKRLLELLKPAQVKMDASLQGPVLRLRDLLGIGIGDVLQFDFPVERPLSLQVNGKTKYSGNLGTTGRRRAFQISQLVSERA